MTRKRKRRRKRKEKRTTRYDYFVYVIQSLFENIQGKGRPHSPASWQCAYFVLSIVSIFISRCSQTRPLRATTLMTRKMKMKRTKTNTSKRPTTLLRPPARSVPLMKLPTKTTPKDQRKSKPRRASCAIPCTQLDSNSKLIRGQTIPKKRPVSVP
ncbi:hypothetical protein GALMADRAFT_386645 [Galerina marginata CBS 339.88]|uniref:Uncharacterized protein n=1 Tax=Galerina marginata (strain CBS 339.88) TaxID=685588 RepID=A0A067U0F8_GALM3|nr:hypothetical protein GALMADRAFT_386645 [Galerina marginata CBS 339.88]